MANKNPARNTPARKKKSHPKTEKFVFETDEARLEIPYIENLPAYIMEELADAKTDGEATRIMIEHLFEDQRDEYRKLTVGEFIELQEKWNEESSISMGEL